MPKFIPGVIPIKRMEPGMHLVLSDFFFPLLSITQVYEATAEDRNIKMVRKKRTPGDLAIVPVLGWSSASVPKGKQHIVRIPAFI